MNVGVIGYGSMGGMLARGWLSSGAVRPAEMAVSNRSIERLEPLGLEYPGVAITDDNREVARFADILFLCVRPLSFRDAIDGFASAKKPGQHLVSLNGSVPTDLIRKAYGSDLVSILIPSVTAEIRSSVSLVAHRPEVPSARREALSSLLGEFGMVVESPEAEIGIASELTSCMPGFIACLFKVLSEEGSRHCSFSPEFVARMVTATLAGTGKLMVERDIGFDELLARVATKGGITEEGARVIGEDFPAVASRVFAETIAKRRLTVERAVASFKAGSV